MNSDELRSSGLGIFSSSVSCLIVLMLLNVGPANAAPPGKGKFLGAATCAASSCHGSVKPRAATNVLQNEYITWAKYGAHANAWKVLRNKDSKRIAALLGIDKAHSAPLCLKCHATYVPEKSRRGKKYRLADGVGCESCHGAAENWIKSHTAKGVSHEQNVANGLLEIVPLKARTKMCLECHLGTDDQEMNHRLIGAGHPRLTFDLDTFSINQPNHWELDDDYVKRKGSYSAARAWAVGQAVRGSEMLKALMSKKRGMDGAMPELANYYCYSCHHSLTEDQWKFTSYGGRPGELRLNVSSLLMVRELLKTINPALGEDIGGKIAGLHQAYQEGRAGPLLKELKAKFDGEVYQAVKGYKYSRKNSQALVKQIATYATKAPRLHYEIAELLAMGIQSVSAGVGSSADAYQKQIDALYDTLTNEEAFSAGKFRTAAKAVLAKL